MGTEVSPQVIRRATRLSSSTTPNSKTTINQTTNHIQSFSIGEILFSGESLTLDELIKSFPGRREQIQHLLSLLGPLDCPMIPLFVYGSASTGKTSVILQIFKHLKRPFIYSSCVTCYSPRILFESILNQLLFHRKNESNSYLSAKKCERPSDFINLLHDALNQFVANLKGKNMGKSSSKKSPSQVNGKMVYLIFDNVELVREWDKSSIILPFLFNLYHILKMPEVGIIFVSKTSPDTFLSDTGYFEPFPVYFPDYKEDDLQQIFMKKQEYPKLYSSFLDLVLRPFCRITRKIDELSTAFSPLFKKYCEPLDDLGTVPSNDMKRKLFSLLQPFISLSLNETFSIPSQTFLKTPSNKETTKRKSIAKKMGINDISVEIDFHMSISAKYLLISAFIASRNPATLDASLFDSTGGHNSGKRKRKSSGKAMENKEIKEQELLMKGPGTFPLERLLAIFQCITSIDEYSSDGEKIQSGDGCDTGLMSDVLLQLSSLCNANFISKGGSCPLEGSIRYRSTVSEDMALKVARSLNFPLSRYLYKQ